MGQAPLPPHERTWRHPSELAAAERDAARTTPVPSSTRAFAMVTGSMGLLAVGMLILTVTPDGDHSPIAIGATTTPAIVPIAAVEVVDSRAPRAIGIAAVGRFASDDTDDDAMPAMVRPGLATPIGDGRSALMTRQSTRAVDGTFDVRLASGTVVSAAVIDTTDDGLVVVTIPTTDDGHAIAGVQPGPDDIVTILVEPPVTVAFSALASMDLEEGTAVLDRDGALIGLCTRGDDGEAGVIDVTGHGVGEEPVDGADAVPATSIAPDDEPGDDDDADHRADDDADDDDDGDRGDDLSDEAAAATTAGP